MSNLVNLIEKVNFLNTIWIEKQSSKGNKPGKNQIQRRKPFQNSFSFDKVMPRTKKYIATDAVVFRPI